MRGAGRRKTEILQTEERKIFHRKIVRDFIEKKRKDFSVRGKKEMSLAEESKILPTEERFHRQKRERDFVKQKERFRQQKKERDSPADERKGSPAEEGKRFPREKKGDIVDRGYADSSAIHSVSAVKLSCFMNGSRLPDERVSFCSSSKGPCIHAVVR